MHNESSENMRLVCISVMLHWMWKYKGHSDIYDLPFVKLSFIVSHVKNDKFIVVIPGHTPLLVCKFTLKQ